MKSCISYFCPCLCIAFLLVVLIGCKKEDEETPQPPAVVPEETTVTDIDGNIYQTVTIGTQTWMAENLKVTHYRNGDPIAHLTDLTQWNNTSAGAFVNYDHSGALGDTFGRLYNWYAVFDGPLLAPAGWHIPSESEWRVLIDYLGGAAEAGGKLKQAGLAHWNPPNTGATNSSGFTALPAGGRWALADFSDLGSSAIWWSSTESNFNTAVSVGLTDVFASVLILDATKNTGYSVRCIKD